MTATHLNCTNLLYPADNLSHRYGRGRTQKQMDGVVTVTNIQHPEPTSRGDSIKALRQFILYLTQARPAVLRGNYQVIPEMALRMIFSFILFHSAKVNKLSESTNKNNVNEFRNILN